MDNLSHTETWKIIPSFPDYEASTLGNIRNKTTFKYITFNENAGYMQSHLYKNKKRYPVKAHRLIAETFLDNPENKEVVNHINSIRNDNRLENLEWNTFQENNEHKAIKHPNNVKKYLRSVWQCDKDTKQQIRMFNSTQEASLSLNKKNVCCVASKIRQVLCGDRMSAYGFYWRYDDYPVIEGEIWKQITYIENVVGYDISSEGRLRNNKGTMFFGHKHSSGYIYVSINDTLYRTHILVAKAFLPNPEDKPHVNHKDGVRDNNKLENLEWVTRSENMQHAYDTGLNSRKNKND
jgi:HNH endonuclease